MCPRLVGIIFKSSDKKNTLTKIQMRFGNGENKTSSVDIIKFIRDVKRRVLTTFDAFSFKNSPP